MSDPKPNTILRTARQVLIEGPAPRPPERLFDAFWRAGEVALLFGAPGAGKSVLAVQIADALAGGRPMNGFQMPRRGRPVLYIDLILSEAQFRTRYSTMPDGRGCRTRRYKFADRLYRDRPGTNEEISAFISRIAANICLEVVIIDDFSAISRSHDGTRETLQLMHRLKRLSLECGLSILVLADSAEPRANVYASEADLKRSRVLCGAADSVFAIARDSPTTSGRYLMQTRSQNEIIWTSKNAPKCDIRTTPDGMVRFAFDERFVSSEMNEKRRDLICRIKKLHDDEGASYREIARELGVSKSLAARLYQKWTPALEDWEAPDDNDADDDNYDESPTDPRFADAEDYEANERYGFDLRPRPPTPPASAAGTRQAVSERPIIDMNDSGKAVCDVSPTLTRGLANRERGVDAYGREILIETTDEHTGKPTIWYSRDNIGNITHHHRKASTVLTKRLGKAEWI